MAGCHSKRSSDEFAGLHLVIIKDKQSDTVHARRQMNRTHFILLRWVGWRGIKTKCATLAMPVSACVCVCVRVFVFASECVGGCLHSVSLSILVRNLTFYAIHN